MEQRFFVQNHIDEHKMRVNNINQQAYKYRKMQKKEAIKQGSFLHQFSSFLKEAFH